MKRSRNLHIPVRTPTDPTERQAWYLRDPGSWRRASVVKREIRGTMHYELHLLCDKPAWRAPKLYENSPSAVVGVDLGVSTMAAVGISSDGVVTGALLVRPDQAEMDRRRDAQAKKRRARRALERSRRNTNPEAYASDKHGRAGKGSRIPGTRLTVSHEYKKKRAALKDIVRKERETRTINTNITARRVVQECGTNIVTEDVQVKAWQKRWGKSIGYFAPSELMVAIEREALHAEGSFTKVPCSLGLTQTCHCGAVKQKSLSERWHTCTVCGAGIDTPAVDRDLHSSYLAAFVQSAPADSASTKTSSKKKASPFVVTLDTSKASTAWERAEAPLTWVSRQAPQGGTIQSHFRDKSWSRSKTSSRTTTHSVHSGDAEERVSDARHLYP